MSNFKVLNNIGGWLAGLIATVVYVLTMEPVASFWDCGEFIAVSYKMMVPHPPGAPLFLIIGRLFSLLALGDTEKVGYFINLLSAVSSGIAVTFLFWTITLIGKKLVIMPAAQKVLGIQKTENTSSEMTDGQMWAVLGAGLVGGLVYTFCDSVWFSAVEAEVYALSSLFTAIVIWAMFRWEAVADQPGADRWLLLIAYLTGLSIGVHLLNLTTVPALGYIYYFKRYKPSAFGFIVTGIVGFVLVLFTMSGVIPGIPSIAGSFEIFAVNTLGLPFNSGVIIFSILFLAAIVYGVIYSIKTKNAGLNLIVLSFIFILIGYCSYGVILIRSNFNPPINENNPSDVLSFVSYLKREQYGDRPLLFGPVFNSRPIAVDKTSPIYMRQGNKYVVIEYKQEYRYDGSDKMLLPRIYSTQGNHLAAYKRWVKLPPEGKKLKMSTNLEFMFKYQIGWMYWRYFMWNFSGRESDIQDANWLSFETADGLPDMLANNKARNQFFMLPFILGLLGLFYAYFRGQRDTWVIFLLWFFTGIGIVIYLNQPPVEPRERDYTFAGSFYAYAIFCGLGVLWLADALGKFLKNPKVAGITATVILLGVPTLMGAVGWDDHDRSDRYFSVDSAKNLLNSCAPNAILFTGGDNDTFPVWYAQEVEGFRTDVRVCNLSLLGTDWYITQMKRKAYDSDPLPITFELPQYVQGKNDYYYMVPNHPRIPKNADLKKVLQLCKIGSPDLVATTEDGASVPALPRSFSLDVDTNAVKAMGILPKNYTGKLVDKLVWDVGKGTALKSDLMQLEMIARNEWKRPIYFSTTLAGGSYLNLKNYMYLEGMAYRLLPIRNDGASQGVVNTEVCYDRMINNMFWRNLDKEGIYLDENYKRFPLNARSSFYRLAETYYNEGKQDKALEVINYCLKVMPDKAVPYDFYMPQFVPLLLKMGQKDLAMEMEAVIGKRAEQDLAYYTKNTKRSQMEIQSNLYVVQTFMFAFNEAGMKDKGKYYENLLEQYGRFADRSAMDYEDYE